MTAGKMDYALELPNRCEFCGNDRAHCKSHKCAKMRQQKHSREVHRDGKAIQLQKSDGATDQ